VPLETKLAFLMKLNETALAVAGVSFVNSQLLFVDEQKYFASSEGSRITQRLVRTYPQFTTTAADRASGDFQTRPVVDRAKLIGYEYVEEYPWLADAENFPMPMAMFALISRMFDPGIAAIASLMILMSIVIVVVLEWLTGLQRAMSV